MQEDKKTQLSIQWIRFMRVQGHAEHPLRAFKCSPGAVWHCTQTPGFKSNVKFIEVPILCALVQQGALGRSSASLSSLRICLHLTHLSSCHQVHRKMYGWFSNRGMYIGNFSQDCVDWEGWHWYTVNVLSTAFASMIVASFLLGSPILEWCRMMIVTICQSVEHILWWSIPLRNSDCDANHPGCFFNPWPRSSFHAILHLLLSAHVFVMPAARVGDIIMSMIWKWPGYARR